MSKIFWNQTERAQVVCRAAILMMDHGYTAFGRTVLEAQKVLPRNRQRPESSILIGAKASFGEDILAEIQAVSMARMNAEKAVKAEETATREEVTPSIEPMQVLPKKGFEQAESLVTLAVESFTGEFRTLLRAALLGTVAEVVEEANESIRKALQKLPTGNLSIHAEIGKEVQAQATGGEEVKATRIKVAIVGGTEKGSDKAIIEDGLSDVYDIRYIDSKGEANRVKNCDLVVIRTSFTNHALTGTVEGLVEKNRIHKIGRSGAKAVNEYLMSHYANMPSV